MKLLVERFDDQDDWRSALKINAEVNEDQTELHFIEGEPKDANLYRDFADVYKIENLVLMAYEAGKNGESLSIKHENYDSFEEL